MRITVLAALIAPVIVVPAAAAAPPPALTAYVGKYPSDKVAGVDFLHHPSVRKAVAGAVSNDGVRRAVLGEGVEVPIERRGAFIVANICEPHNCADHQWTIVISAPGRRAAVCYHDADLMNGEARWFVGGSPFYRESNGCWSGEHPAVPTSVAAELAKAHR